MNRHISILSMEHMYERYLTQALFLLLGVAVLGYLYFVGASVINIIARKEATAEVARLQSAIALQEKEYFALTSQMELATAHQLGLAPVSKKSFVHRPGNSASLDTIERDAI